MVGRNGEGKTTLLRILAGQLAPDSGSVSMPRGASVALHDQRPPLDSELTLEDVRRPGHGAGAAGRARAGRAGGAHGRGRRAAPRCWPPTRRPTRALERAGGYAWRAWMERVLRGLGIDEDQLPRPLRSFSGGELTRASLARSLVSPPGRPAARRAHQPPRHRGGRVAREDDRRDRRGRRPGVPRPLVPGVGRDGRARDRPRARRATGRWGTRRSGASARSPSTARGPRPSARPRRSPVSSASSSAGGPAPRRARRPRARSGSTGSSGSRSRAGRPTWRSGSPRASAAGGW